MKRFKLIMIKLKAGLNGNKTILGTSLIAYLTNFPLPQPWQGIAITIITIFTGVSAVHHIKKGYLTTKKGS